MICESDEIVFIQSIIAFASASLGSDAGSFSLLFAPVEMSPSFILTFLNSNFSTTKGMVVQ